jgi:lipopolysaccharide export system permease protein
MPIIWRYLIGHYFKVLILCVLAFVAILVTTRLDEIAHFATLGPGGIPILLFTLHQIPYILPIAIPVSGLISAILLIQRLSQTHELTALRASGLSLTYILAPILLAAALMSLASFYVVSELASHSHLATGRLKNELRSLNPLLLLHNKHLLRLKGMVYHTLGPSKLGETASDVILAIPNKHQQRINLLLAKKLSVHPTFFKGEHVSYLTPFEAKEGPYPDSLWIENIEETLTTSEDFSEIVHNKIWNINPDHLRLPLLLARLTLEKELGSKKNRQRCYSEIIRRFSLALAAFTFTLMGASFGMTITRNRSRRGIIYVLCLTALYLTAFFVAKDLDNRCDIAASLYLTPHALILLCSLWNLRRVTRGIE